MTNDQQTILGQVSGSEAQLSQQETIQLTELLPVEQSRIKDNPDYKDQETTDGLRALRSFARGEHQDFVEHRELDCYRKIDRSYETTLLGATTRGSEAKRRKINGFDETTNGMVMMTCPKEGNVGKRRNDRFKGTKRKKKNSDDSEDSENDEDGTDKEDNEIESNRLNSMVDDVDNVYYHEKSDSREASVNGEDTSGNLEILSAGVYRDMANNFSDLSRLRESSGKIEKTVGKQRKKKTREQARRKKRKPSEKLKKSTKVEKRKEINGFNVNALSNREEAQKDVRLKIDGIIQANYLLERENNNVVHKNRNESGDDTKCSSSKAWKELETVENITETNNVSKKSTVEQGETTKKYFCVMCNSRFKGSGGLRNHYKVVHAAGPSYKCDECGKEFPLKERLKLHVRTHTGFKPYKCPDCHKSFARGGQLVQHRGTHSKIKPYRCSLCTGTFTCAANLALHVKRHNGQKDHKCDICGRGFVRKDALKKHLECLHRDVKSFLCVICNKTFKGHLPQHMRTHAHHRPHGCATCGQRFAQKSQLTVHQRTHSGQRPFRCLVCWQAFAHSTALKLHTRRHTGERPFKCVECNAGFTQLPHWKKHMKCIHGRNEPYSCANCKSFFRIKSDLENHEKTCRCDDRVNNIEKTINIGDRTSADNPYTLSSDSPKFRAMNVERMRLLLAVLLKRISKPDRLHQLGFGKRLIDEVLQDSLVSAGKEPSRIGELNELESLRKNLETFLEWTVPKVHWEKFRKTNKTPEEILEILTAT